jgi:hypothetical protein
MRRMKTYLLQLAEKYPELLNPFWKAYYRFNRILESYNGPAVCDRRSAFHALYLENAWGSEESISGPGSTLHYTKILRRKLPSLLRSLNVRTLLDAPCGDFNWMRYVPLNNIKYIGGDIVEELIRQLSDEFSGTLLTFRVLDIVDGNIPPADLWICRDALFHLPDADCKRVLMQFANSEIKYFLTTTFEISNENIDISPGGFRYLNLRIAPFNLPKPLRSIDDFVAPFAPRSLALWSRDQVRAAVAPNLG